MLAALFAVLPLALAVDAEPPADDLWRWPHPSVCRINACHAAEYLAWLDAVAPIYPTYAGVFHDARNDALGRLQAWQALEWAWQCPADGRRAALGRLRAMLGFQNYLAGTMPAPFPVSP